MLKKFLSLVFSVALLVNCCGLFTYAQSGRVSVHRDGSRNSLAKHSNASPSVVSEDAQRETVKATNEVRPGSKQISHSNNLSKGDKIVGIALLSYAILAAVLIAN